jgi:hypothetical protein
LQLSIEYIPALRFSAHIVASASETAATDVDEVRHCIENALSIVDDLRGKSFNDQLEVGRPAGPLRCLVSVLLVTSGTSAETLGIITEETRVAALVEAQ